MKFTVSQEALNKALAVAARALAAKPTMPILAGLLLEAKGTNLTLRATDLALGIDHTIPVKVEAEGITVVNGKFLVDLVRKLPSGDLVLEADSNGCLLRYGKNSYKLAVIDAKQFPETPQAGTPLLSLAQGTLKRIFGLTEWAASEDGNRPYLQGVSMTLREAEIDALATDGTRIASTRTKVENPAGSAFSVICPSTAAAVLSRLLGDEDPVAISIASNNGIAVFDMPVTRVYTRLLEGKFPDVMRLVPGAYPTVATVPAIPLKEALGRALLLEESVALEIRPGAMTITASRAERGSSSEELVIGTDGQPMKIGFNPKLLMDGIEVIGGDVKMEMSGERTPARITPSAKDGPVDFTYIVLPLVKY